MAASNLFRRRLRSLVTLAGVAVASAALFCLVGFERGYQGGLKAEMDRLGAHILVAPKGCPYDAASIALHGASWPCYLKDEYLHEIKHAGGVATAAPLLMNAVYDEQTARPHVYIGADRQLLALKKGWRINGRFPEN